MMVLVESEVSLRPKLERKCVILIQFGARRSLDHATISKYWGKVVHLLVIIFALYTILSRV